MLNMFLGTPRHIRPHKLMWGGCAVDIHLTDVGLMCDRYSFIIRKGVRVVGVRYVAPDPVHTH